MGKERSVRFVVHYPEPRCVLSVIEREPSLDLLLGLRTVGRKRDLGSQFGLISTNGDDVFRDLKYSIHSSSVSSQNINLIKLHIEQSDGTNVDYFQYTSAIKDGRRFSPVYTRKCEYLKDRIFDIKKPGKSNIDLGHIDDNFSLVFGVFIGAAGNKFILPSEATCDFNFSQTDFKKFSVVVLWSFLPTLDHSTGIIGHLVSRTNKGIYAGEDEAGCMREFNRARERIRLEALAAQLELYPRPEERLSREILRRARYLSAGTIDSPEAKEFEESVRISLANLKPSDPELPSPLLTNETPDVVFRHSRLNQ